MLNRKSRLTRERDFNQVYRQGKRAGLSAIVLYCRKRSGDGPTRFGFVVSKKSVPQTVHRNRIKRVLRGQARHFLPQVVAGNDVIIQVRPKILKLSTQEIGQELKTGLRKVNLI